MQTELTNRNLIIKINGDIDHHIVREIKSKIEREYRHSNARNIIFDLSSVNFMDSSGIGMIIGRYKFLRNSGASLAIVNIKPELESIIEISGLKKIISFYPSVNDALKNLR